MQHNYTRQRQGRDFYSNNNDPNDDTEQKSIIERLEQFKEEAERNGIPIDGYEPPERTRFNNG